MPGFPGKRLRNQLVDQAINAAVQGIDPRLILDPHGSVFQSDVWRFLLDTLVRMRLGLTRRGAELVGDCTACGLPALTVGRLKARCGQCGLDVESLAYLRMQLARYNGDRRN